MQTTQKTAHLLTTFFYSFSPVLLLISQVILEKFTNSAWQGPQHIIGTDELAVRFRAAFFIE
jgi:hypothetical protein